MNRKSTPTYAVAEDAPGKTAEKATAVREEIPATDNAAGEDHGRMLKNTYYIKKVPIAIDKSFSNWNFSYLIFPVYYSTTGCNEIINGSSKLPFAPSSWNANDSVAL